jgi:arylformamidase
MAVWSGDSPIEIERVSKIKDGANANVSKLTMSLHAGTHIDAPYHFLDGGLTVEKIPLKMLFGRAYVLHVPDDVNLITADLIKNSSIPPRTRRVLFKTRNSKIWDSKNKNSFQEDFVAISPDAAEYLVKRGVKLIGVDYLSVAPFNDSVPTHTILLQANVVIVEGLNLSEVSQGRYTLYCLPLKISSVDGAPARAILVGV